MPSLNDLTGQKYNRLTVIRRDTSKPKGVYWICKCDCGNTVSVRAYNLTSGSTKSCGCLNRENIHQKRRNSEDLTGRVIGNLEVIRYVDSDHNGTRWECKCLLCGNKKVLPAAWIKQYDSCGCVGAKNRISNVEKHNKKLSKSQSNTLVLKEKANQNNMTTGIRGVCYISTTHQYVAYITYRKKRYSLLKSTDINQCIAARKAAEKAVRADFLEWYKKEYHSNKQE